MSRARGRASDAPANEKSQKPPKDSERPEAAEDEATGQDMVEQDPFNRLDGLSPQEAIASNAYGAPNEYPYLDKTSTPLHERDLPMSTDAAGPSQAELNPAFYPKAEDGGPTTSEGEGIGTEPNIHDQMLAAAENSGVEGAVEQVQEQIEQGQKEQIDAEAVTAAAQERAPEGIDASTGQPEGQATPPGAPSGMEPDSKTTEGERVEVAGAKGDPSDSEGDNAKAPGSGE